MVLEEVLLEEGISTHFNFYYSPLFPPFTYDLLERALLMEIKYSLLLLVAFLVLQACILLIQ